MQYCSDDVDNLWDLLTVYIDKLHSLELLIVEEIEC
jgi:RNAse (barnase) inhibitor barstar